MAIPGLDNINIDLGGFSNTAFNTIIIAAFVILGGMAIIVAWLLIRQLFIYNIRVMIYKNVDGTLVYREDWARHFKSKKDQMMSFKLRKTKIDLFTLIDKSGKFIQSKRPFWGYGDAVMLLQDGPDQQIDSYNIIKPPSFRDGLLKHDQQYEDLTTGVSKADWIANENRIRAEYDELPWWKTPMAGFVVQGVSIAVIVMIFVLGGKLMMDMLQSATGYNQAALDSMEAMKEGIQQMTIACKNLG